MQGGHWRISRWGFGACAVYALIIVVCFATTALGHFDLKSRSFLQTVPFSLQAALIDELGFSETLSLPWPVVDALFALPMFIGLYLIGMAFDRGSMSE